LSFLFIGVKYSRKGAGLQSFYFTQIQERFKQILQIIIFFALINLKIIFRINSNLPNLREMKKNFVT